MQPRSRSSKMLCSSRAGKPGSRGPSVHKLLVVGVFPLKHWGGGDGSWHGILRLPMGMRTERRSCCRAKKSQCSSKDLLEVGGPQSQWGARVLSTLLEGTSVHLGSYGSCQVLAFGAAVDLPCMRMGAGAWQGGRSRRRCCCEPGGPGLGCASRVRVLCSSCGDSGLLRDLSPSSLGHALPKDTSRLSPLVSGLATVDLP